MIKVGSDFSGVGAFIQALLRLNIKHKEVFACDMDKYARETYLNNYEAPDDFPEDVYLREIPEDPLDIYMTSPPCQAFSLAGKRKGEEDKRGVLFYNSHEFIKENNPRFFIFENVKGLLSDDKVDKKSPYGRTFNRWLDYLGGKSINGNPILFPHEESVPYHIYHFVLNAKKYGVPQNRERVFIVGIRDDEDNYFRTPKPFPLKKRLKDVVEYNVDEKYYLSEEMVNNLIKYNERQEENGNGFKADFRDIEEVDVMSTIKVGGGGKDDLIKVGFINQDTQASQVYDEEGVSPTLSAGSHGYANGYLTGRIVGRNPDNPKSRKSGEKTEQMVEINEDATCINTLTTVQKDNVIIEHRGHKDKEPKIIEDGISPCLRAESHGHQPKIIESGTLRTHKDGRGFRKIKDGNCPTIQARAREDGSGQPVVKIYSDEKHYRIRRLTPRECFRIMDFPDSFQWLCSDTQAYKQAGNSIVVECLVQIIQTLKL